MECVGSLKSQCTVDEGEEGAGGGRRGQEGEGEGRRGTERAGGGRRGTERAGGGRRGQEGAGGGRRGQEGAEGDGEGRRGQEGACRRGMGDSNNTPQASLQVVRITVLPPYQVNNAIAAIRTPNNYINYI